MNNNKNSTNIIINFSEKYTFGQMLDKLSEDSTLSFVSEGMLYFKRKDKLLTTNYSNKTIYDVVHAKPMSLSTESLEKTYYLTNIYISNIIYEISIEKVKEHLLNGETVMLNINSRTWIIYIEDKVVYLDYTEADGADENNYKELFATDVLASLLEGQYYVIDGEVNDE